MPYLVFLNGTDIVPLSKSWAVLLSIFINEVNQYGGNELTDEIMEGIKVKCLDKAQEIYRYMDRTSLREDLYKIMKGLCDVAYGREPEDIGYMSLGEYAPYMTAPHRMDLMVAAMTKNGKWNCPHKCVHCYACDQPQAEVEELSTEEWKSIIDKCKEANIPQLTFTGGEPTTRKDLVELIDYSRWFVTRLNTNGVLLTKDLCSQLYRASLDSVQITLYSDNPEIHNKLVGAEKHHKTIEGIKNAIEAGLSVSINTPLCTMNKEYVNTLKLLKKLGVTYVTCSGLIMTGNATKEESISTQLSEKELYQILCDAVVFCNENKMQIAFTSPGWIPEEKIISMGLTVPSCGACLSNMAITPNGNVVPCQSWLSNEGVLGNMHTDKWHKIWNHPFCIERRQYTAKMLGECPLRATDTSKEV